MGKCFLPFFIGFLAIGLYLERRLTFFWVKFLFFYFEPDSNQKFHYFTIISDLIGILDS